MGVGVGVGSVSRVLNVMVSLKLDVSPLWSSILIVA